MISLPLFKRNLKSGSKVGLIFLAILAMYTSIIIYMFDPKLAELLEQYQQMMPEMMSAVGMTGGGSSLIAFIHTYLYGFLMMIIPMIFSILLVHKLVMKYIDTGAMASILATPNARRKIIVTQMISILLEILLLFILVMAIGFISSEVMFPGELDWRKYLLLNISMLLLQCALSGISFLSACFFDDSKGFLAAGVGIPIVFYLIKMLSNMGDQLEKLKYITIDTLFAGQLIIEGSSDVIFYNLILGVIAVIFYTLGVEIFVRKDLNL